MRLSHHHTSSFLKTLSHRLSTRVWQTQVHWIAVLVMTLSFPVHAQLTQTGLTLSFDANQDQDGNGRWESLVGGSTLDLLLDPLVLRSTAPLTSGFAGITNTYSFPGSGIAEATNALGAQFTAAGTGTIQSLTNIAGDPTNNPASWEIWFRPDSLSTSGVDQVLFEDGGGTGISLSVKDGILSARKLPTLAVKTFDLSTLTPGEFIQAVATYNTTTNVLELFVNGVSVGGAAATSSGGDWSGSDPAALGTRGGSNMGGFGNGSSGVASFDGDIAAFRFYESILSSTDVMNNYNAVTATTVFFDNDGADGLWTTQSNWDTNIQPTSAQDVVINSGLSVTVDAAGEVANNLTIGSTASSTLSPVVSGAGTLTLTGGDLTVAGTLTIGDGQDGVLALTGGTLNAQGGIAAGTAVSTLTLNGGTLNMNGNAIGSGSAPVTNLTFAAGILDSVTEINGGAALVKSTAGTLTLSGTNTYTGATSVNAGTLVLSGSVTSGITVASGANLDGEGSTTGSVVFLGTTHTINADTSTAAALGSTGTGGLDVSALNVGGFTVNITGTTYIGTKDILTYGSGGFTGALDRFVASTALTPSARGASFGDSGTAITYDLGYVTNTWTGSVNNNWDIGATANWSNAKDNVFQNGDDLVFDDSATRFSPTLQTNVTVGSITFNNSTGKNYTLKPLTSQFITVNDSIQFTGSGNVTISTKLAGNASLTKSGSGTVTLSGANTYSGLTTVNEGTLRLTNSAISSGRVYEPVAAGATLEFNVTSSTNPGVFNLSGDGTFVKTGRGAFVQTSAGSTFSMGSGALIRIADGSYDFGGGGLGDWSANKADFQVDFGATFDGSATAIVFDALDGEGTLKIAGNSTDGFGLKLGVDNGSGTFTGAIVNSTPDGDQFSVIKEGSGTQILSGNNTYTGATTINGGLLVVNGTLGGNITVAAGANIGGEASTAGNLTFLGTTHTLEVDARTAAVLGATGTGGLDISAVGTGGLTINIIGMGNGGGAGGAGGLKVLTYGSGGFIGDLASFTLGAHTLSSRLATAGAFIDNGVDAITIDLGYVTNTWVGGDGSNPTFWDIGTTANWSNAKDSVFQNGDDVIFADGASNLAPTLRSDVTAGVVIFSNTAGTDYTLNSTAGEALTTVGTLSVTGSGNVTINANVSAGSGIVTSGSGNTTINGVISGASGLTQSGTSVTTLTGSNTFSGAMIITDGTLRISDESNLGSNPASFSTRQLYLNGAGATLSAAASFTINDNNRGIYIDTDGGHIGVDAGMTLTIARVIDGIGILDKTGAGTLELTAANTYSGTTTVSEGTLRLVNSAITTDRSYGSIAS
ncbi:MAG: autotransporter-associated beta strand repeat-containing protein, partial [Prosthecobacter sp.]